MGGGGNTFGGGVSAGLNKTSGGILGSPGGGFRSTGPEGMGPPEPTSMGYMVGQLVGAHIGSRSGISTLGALFSPQNTGGNSDSITKAIQSQYGQSGFASTPSTSAYPDMQPMEPMSPDTSIPAQAPNPMGTAASQDFGMSQSQGQEAKGLISSVLGIIGPIIAAL